MIIMWKVEIIEDYSDYHVKHNFGLFLAWCETHKYTANEECRNFACQTLNGKLEVQR
jgi:hypothetical protein